MKKSLKTYFFGTPAVAVPFLECLQENSRVLGVVTNPDRPAGRGHDLQSSPVKAAAQKLGLNIHQPETLKDFRLTEVPDLALVVAYGKLIPPSLFDAPRFGMVNVHFSLLPRYRGAGPVQWALIRGEPETGVSLFRIDKGMDTGPVYCQRSVAVKDEDNSATLRERLVAAGLELTRDFLRKLEEGGLEPAPQKGTPSPAPLLKKDDGRLRWSRQSAGDVVNLIRGTFEWPGAFSYLKGSCLKVRAAAQGPDQVGRPGEILALARGRGFLVKCSSGTVIVTRVQPEGKKEMDAESFWNGARLAPGDKFMEDTEK